MVIYTFMIICSGVFKIPHPSTLFNNRDAPGRSYKKHLLSGNNAHLRRPFAPHKPHYYVNSPIRAYRGSSPQEILPYKNTLGNPGCQGCVVAVHTRSPTRLYAQHTKRVYGVQSLSSSGFISVDSLCCCRLSFIFIVYSPHGHKFSVSFFLTNSTMLTRDLGNRVVR